MLLEPPTAAAQPDDHKVNMMLQLKQPTFIKTLKGPIGVVLSIINNTSKR